MSGWMGKRRLDELEGSCQVGTFCSCSLLYQHDYAPTLRGLFKSPDDTTSAVQDRNENDGWTVAKYLLEHERGTSFAAGIQQKLKEVKRIAAVESSGNDALINDFDFSKKIAQAEIQLLGIDITEQRIISGISVGSGGPADPSALKLMGSEVSQAIDDLAVQAVGQFAQPDFSNVREGRTNWSAGPDYAIPLVGRYLNNRASTIYGGSSEVQRNIISKVLFGL